MSEQSNSWCLIESDPGVFTELLHGMGALGVQVEELYSLDEGSLMSLDPIYGLIFLFKWEEGVSKNDMEVSETSSEADSGIYFARQMIHNACATQAILNLVMNVPQIQLGPHLQEFKTFTEEFSPELKGLSISNSELIRKLHNSFAKPEFISHFEEKLSKQSKSGESEDAFHFTCFLPFHGTVFELDGLKPAALAIGQYDAANSRSWLDVAVPVLVDRMSRCANSDIRFNCMALVKDRCMVLKESMAEVQQQLSAAEEEKSEPHSETLERSELKILRHQLKQIEMDLEAELYKREQYKKENILRRHNFVPLIFECLKIHLQTQPVQK